MGYLYCASRKEKIFFIFNKKRLIISVGYTYLCGMKISIGLTRHLLSSKPGVLNAWWFLMKVRSLPNCMEKFHKDRFKELSVPPLRRRRLLKTCINQGWIRKDKKGNYFPVGSEELFGMYCGGNSCASFECPDFDTTRELQNYLCGVIVQALGNALRYQASKDKEKKREANTRSTGAGSATSHSQIPVSLKLITQFVGCTYKNSFQLRKKAVESGLVSFTRQYSNFSVLNNTPKRLVGRAKESMNPEDARKIVYYEGSFCIECSSLCIYTPLTYVKKKVKAAQ
jgi:hypothetical protein